MAGNRGIWEQLDDRIYQVRVPLPFPLRWINAYLVRGEEGFTLIDPGLRTVDAITVWDETLATIGIDDSDIKQIVLTHHHPDHVGLAGEFQQRSGAKVWLSEQGIEQVRYLWSEERKATEELHALFTLHGMDHETGEKMLEHLESFIPLVSPLPVFSQLQADAVITMGGRVYRTIHAPGHAYGQMLLLDETSGDLFCGDHLLPKITPNVGLLPRFDSNPLQSFMDSLAAIDTLAVKRVLPGHRDPFEGFADRCRYLIHHHQERLEKMLGMLERPLTGFELCHAFFGQSLSIHQLRFALAETLAHLVYLREQGKTAELPPDEANPAVRYVRM